MSKVTVELESREHALFLLELLQKQRDILHANPERETDNGIRDDYFLAVDCLWSFEKALKQEGK